VDDVADWIGRLDSKKEILGFDDKVYDFSIKAFRDGTPEDMVTLSVGHSSKDLKRTKRSKEILNEIKNIVSKLGTHELMQYTVRHLATSVHGDRPLDQFHIWTGTGANGKGLLTALMAMALGKYCYTPDQVLFAARSAKSGSTLSSELAKMKGKRLIITSETDNTKDYLRVGLLKKCSGHDRIQARDLYQTCDEFRCFANIILIFNDIPGIDASDGGLRRRIKLTQFLKKAVENPQLAHEIQIDNTLHGKFDSEEYGAAWLAYLIETFNEFGFQFPTPEEVDISTNDYIHEHDLVGQFITDNYEVTNNFEDKVYLRDIWTEWNSDSQYRQAGLRQSRDLSQKLRNKGLTLKTLHGLAVVRYLKIKTAATS
jgi:phage/plasmid-associated DNA primase